MLLDSFPTITDAMGKLAYGLQPIEILPSGQFMMVVKAPKEAILAARRNAAIRFYLAPGATEPGCAAGVVTAFLDDGDEPLVIVTPLFSGDAMLEDLAGVLSQDVFDLHLLDEFDREAVSVRAVNRDAPRFRDQVRRTGFPAFYIETASAAVDTLHTWFGRRDPSDDAAAFTVTFEKRYPPGTAPTCGRWPSDPPPGGRTSPAGLPAGAWQEREIAALLGRAFPHGAVLLNPMRLDTGTELTDILVITDELVLLVQAKDSPNCGASLDRTMDRKRSVASAHVGKAARQLRGALRHIAGGTAGLRVAGSPQSVRVGGRALRGLVVVQELFDPDIAACSAAVLGVAEERGAPCMLLTFGKLHEMALHLPSPDRFLAGLDSVYRMAVGSGSYPAPRFIREPTPRTQPDPA